jgi:hypothetical protein
MAAHVRAALRNCLRVGAAALLVIDVANE